MAEQSQIPRLFHVRLTQDEFAELCSRANTQGLSADEALRAAALAWIATDRATPQPSFFPGIP